MNSLFRPFYHTFRWTAIESVLYEILLLAHQFLLYTCIDSRLFGLIGAFIGLVYLFVYTLNLGFDKALAPYFQTYAQSKESIKSLLLVHIIPTYAIIACLSLLGFMFLNYLSPYFAWGISPLSFVLFATIVLVEIHKRFVKTMLRLSMQAHIAAPLELATLLAYFVCVWGSYFIRKEITFYTAIVPLLISAIIGSILMFFYTFQWYKTLPEKNNNFPQKTHLAFFKNRVSTLFLHLNRQFFTTNFFIPFFAYFYGLSAAGTLKIASRVTSTIMVIMRKVLETPTNVFFANTHDKENKKQVIFSYASYWINQAAYAAIIFAIINHVKLLGNTPTIQTDMTDIVYLGVLYFIIRICGNFCIAYEQFYIAHEKPAYLVIINSISLLLLVIILKFATTLSALSLLVSISLMRIISCVLFAGFSYYWWQIKPNWKVNPLCQLSALIFSLLFYYDFFHYLFSLSNSFLIHLIS